MWTRGLLTALWTIQIPILAVRVSQGVLNLIFFLVQHGHHYVPYAENTTKEVNVPGLHYYRLFTILAWRVADTVILILGLVEIVRYRHGRLQPQFFTISHGVRAAIQSVEFYFVARLYLRWRSYGRPHYSDVVLSALML